VRRSTRSVLAATAGAALVGVLASAAPPAGSDPQKARQHAMEQIGDAMKTLGKMAKGQLPFDTKVVGAQATTIAERLGEAAQLFPPGSDAGETHAMPEVWSDRAGFEKTMKDAQAAASALQSVKDEAAYRPALGTLGQSCKACHDKYRMPDM
jgi:cytochrome c556